VKCRGSADVRRARRGRRPACARRSSAKDSPRAVPQTAVMPIVTRHYTSGLLNFATNPPEDSLANTTEDTVLRAPSGLDGWDRSSTDRRFRRPMPKRASSWRCSASPVLRSAPGQLRFQEGWSQGAW
jgi:hypothetical protein